MKGVRVIYCKKNENWKELLPILNKIYSKINNNELLPNNNIKEKYDIDELSDISL